VARCIIVKLPSSWRNFATSLKHKRQKISVEKWIASLDVEEKARVKNNIEKGDEEKLASTSSRETHMARTKESLSLSMPNQQLPSRRRRKTKQSCLPSLVESLDTLLKSVRSERAEKRKRRMSTS
jgi:hypothetical protein